jgi:hypothetical protein
MLDIERALTFMSDDPKASEKVGLGALIALTPFLNVAAIGYQVEVTRRVAQGAAQTTPDWNNLQQLWKQGAWLALAYYLYSLPVLFIVFGGIGLGLAGIVLSLQSEAVQTGRSSAAPALLIFGLVFVVVLVAFIYGLLIGWLRPAILAEYAQRGTFGACFDFRAMWRFMRQNPAEYLQLWLLDMAVGIILSVPLILVILILAWAPFIGPLLGTLVAAGVAFFEFLFSGHLVGQVLHARTQSPT